MEKIGIGLMYIYIIGSAIATPYFNWLYAHNHGFVKWLFFGEIIATIQALIWPISLFFK